MSGTVTLLPAIYGPSPGVVHRQAGTSDIVRVPVGDALPGLEIILSVLGFNLLGDGLRDALDPRLRL